MNRRTLLAVLVVCLAFIAKAVSPDESRARPLGQELPTPTDVSATALPDLLIAHAYSDREWNGRCWDDGPHPPVINVRVENRGEGPAGHFLVRGEDGDPTPVPWAVDGLSAGESEWLGLRRGDARVLVVDPDNEVAESDEANNRLERMPTYVMTQPPTCSPTPVPVGYLPSLRR